MLQMYSLSLEAKARGVSGTSIKSDLLCLVTRKSWYGVVIYYTLLYLNSKHITQFNHPWDRANKGGSNFLRHSKLNKKANRTHEPMRLKTAHIRRNWCTMVMSDYHYFPNTINAIIHLEYWCTIYSCYSYDRKHQKKSEGNILLRYGTLVKYFSK